MKILYGFLAFVLLLVIAAFVVPSMMNWDSYKPEISESVEALTGRSLAIDGDIDIAILPTPKLRISDVRFANVAGATASDMARLRALDLKLALGPLLSGNFQLSSLELIDPVIELERLEDGRENWKFEPADKEPGETSTLAGGKAEEDVLTSFSLDSMSIINGTLVYRDNASGQVEYIQHLNFNLSAESLNGPFRGEGRMEVRGLETEFQFTGGRKRADGHMPISLKTVLGDGLAQLGFDGKLEIGEGGSEGSGTLRASGNNLANLIDALSTNSARKLAAEKFSLKSEVVLSPSGITLNKFQFRVGETQASGNIAYDAVTQAQLEATLAINRLDLDKIAQNSAAWENGGDNAPAAVSDDEVSGNSLTDTTKDEIEFGDYLGMLPDDIAATLDLAVQTLRYRGGVVQQAHMVVSLDDGFITVQQASALLPGGSNAALFGQLSPGENGPHFDGQVEMVSHDLRAIISWLDLMELNGIPSDRLRRFSLATAINISEQGAELSELDLTIDASRLNGFAKFSFGAQNSIEANLHLDQLNADAYLDTDYAPGAAAVGGSRLGATDTADDPAPVEKDSTVLDNLEAKLKLTAGSLSYGGAILSDVSLKGVLRDKVLIVEELDVADLSGAKLALNGEIRDPIGEVDLNLAFDVQAESILGLIRVAGIAPSFRADNVGAIHLSGTLSGGHEAVNLNARLKARPATISLIGSINDPFADAALNLGLEMRAPDVAELMRAADMTPPKLIRRLGPLAIDGGFDGGLKTLNMSLSTRAAGNHLKIVGNLADFSGAGRYNLAFDLTNPSFAALAELLSSEPYETAEVGGVQIKGRLAGDNAAAKLSDLTLALGNTQISGNADVILDGPLPVFNADFDAGLLDARLFIGGTMTSEDAARANGNAASGGDNASKSARQPRRAAAARWSNETFDLAPLSEFEGDISIISDAILAGRYRLDQAEVKFRVTGGTLEINSLRGRIFDGLLEAEGSIVDASPPHANLTFKLDNIDLAAGLRQIADIDAVTGRATIDGRFTSDGYSEYDMARALQGTATFNATNGTIEGLGLPTLSDQLNDLHVATDFLRLAGDGLSSGTTKLDSINGTIQVMNGLAITNDFTLLIDGAQGKVHGNADLPSWQLDLTALFQLTDHPKAPPVGVRMTGAIDQPARELLLAGMQAHIAKTAMGNVLLPKLRHGAKAESGSLENAALRGIFGDPDNSASSRTSMPSPVDSKPDLTPQQGGSENTDLAVQPDNDVAPSDLTPQQSAPEPIPERAKSDPLSPQDILKGALEILND